VPISTDVGDARLIVGDTGQIVERGDADAITGAINAYLLASSEERARRGAKARTRIDENYTIGKAVEAFARLYEIPAQ
jgi:glycosyltransferase involved in cell wall biosynthesis